MAFSEYHCILYILKPTSVFPVVVDCTAALMTVEG